MTHSLWERERERERERDVPLFERSNLSEWRCQKNLREQYTIVGFGSQVSFWILLFGVVERRWTKTVRWRCFGCSTCSILLCLLEDGSTTVLGTNPSISRKMDNERSTFASTKRENEKKSTPHHHPYAYSQSISVFRTHSKNYPFLYDTIILYLKKN